MDIVRETPSFRMTELNDAGLLTISFTQKMKLVQDLTEITEEVFKIELLPDESNEYMDDSIEQLFSWTVSEFEEFYMKIQVNWVEPTQISAGLKRDLL